jgi:hypothetical protein
VITAAERFHLFVRILDSADYQFIRQLDPRAEHKLRRDRMRIFRRELRAIAVDSASLYRARAANLGAVGRWQAYPSLVLDTMSSFVSIGKLAAAGTLFAWRLPLVIDAARNANRVLRFVTNEKFSPAPQNLPV